MNDEETAGLGGYDEGYLACSCFWGRTPGSLIRNLQTQVGNWTDVRVLDAGCGEGKNAIYVARLGARVLAVDICSIAIAHARLAWEDADSVEWTIGDIREMALAEGRYGVVIAYGLLHCLRTREEVTDTIRRLQAATQPGGYHVICVFNNREQDLRAHPGFSPTLLHHSDYVGLYASWDTTIATDSTLHEVHPHNGIPHSHSLTRILARKGAMS